MGSLEYLADFFKIIFNPTIAFKGGTAILIDKKLDIELSKSYLHPGSRITMVSLIMQGHSIDLFCVYAHSGTNVCKEREEFFEKELLPLIRNQSDKVILGGDWNCVVSNRDCSNPRNSSLSQNFTNIIQTVGLKDVHNLTNKIPEYTFIKQNYASRLDRFYTAKYSEGVCF